MTRALDVYRNLQIELDKHESPSFEITDFNYLFPSAIREVIAEDYVGFDGTQKKLDDLRAILVLNHPVTFNNGFAPLPDQYFHILHLEAILEMLQETEDNSEGDNITVYPKRLRTNRKGFVQKNAYSQQSSDEPYFQVDKDNIYVLSGTDSRPLTGKMDYLEIPADVYLNPDTTVDYGLEKNNTTLQFPDHVNYEFIKRCRQIFLENIESPRYGSTVQENQLRKITE